MVAIPHSKNIEKGLQERLENIQAQPQMRKEPYSTKKISMSCEKLERERDNNNK